MRPKDLVVKEVKPEKKKTVSTAEASSVVVSSVANQEAAAAAQAALEAAAVIETAALKLRNSLNENAAVFVEHLRSEIRPKINVRCLRVVLHHLPIICMGRAVLNFYRCSGARGSGR